METTPNTRRGEAHMEAARGYLEHAREAAIDSNNGELPDADDALRFATVEALLAVAEFIDQVGWKLSTLQ